MHATVFCGNQSVLIELHQSGVIAWRPRQHHRSCGLFRSWISVAHCPLKRKWRVLHIWYISVLEQIGMSFNGIAHLMKVYLLFKREFPHVLHDDVTHRSCANFKCEVAYVNNGIPIDFGAVKCVSVESDQPCYDNISWYFSSTNLYYSYFTRPLLHAVCNTWLTPVTVCGSQSTACGIEMRWGQLWIGVNCNLEENICSQNC